jgi:hypothetical protein
MLPERVTRKQRMAPRVLGLRKAIKTALLFAFPDGLVLTARYLIKQRRIPNLIRPSALSEKALCKMLFDRNELLPIISDKLAVRDFVRSRVGPTVLKKIYAVYENETEIQLDDLPDRFVLKANHGSVMNYFVESAADKNPDIIVPIARRWLTTNFGRQNGAWAYKSIHPRIFAEERLENIEYKISCFDGEPKFLKVLIGLKPDRRSRFFDLDWNTFEVAEINPNFPRDMISRPANLTEMVEISRRLSRGFDFLRVDLYNIHNRIFFGELTNYHNGSVNAFHPREYDYKFGSYWNPGSMTYLPVKWKMPAKIMNWPGVKR